jgi:hypothetical protein
LYPICVVPRAAKNGAAYVAGLEPPRYEDTEGTLDQPKERVAKTGAFLKTLDRQAIDGSAERYYSRILLMVMTVCSTRYARRPARQAAYLSTN